MLFLARRLFVSKMQNICNRHVIRASSWQASRRADTVTDSKGKQHSKIKSTGRGEGTYANSAHQKTPKRKKVARYTRQMKATTIAKWVLSELWKKSAKQRVLRQHSAEILSFVARQKKLVQRSENTPFLHS